MTELFCECCGDACVAVFPCKFIYHDNLTVDFNICLDCMDHGVLKIDLKRKRLVGSILKRLSGAKSRWLWRTKRIEGGV